MSSVADKRDKMCYCCNFQHVNVDVSIFWVFADVPSVRVLMLIDVL